MAKIELNERVKGFVNSALKSFSARDYATALAALKEAESLDKQNPEILYNLGIAHCKMGQFRESIDYFKKLLKLPFTFVDIITVNKLLSYALILLDELPQAVEYLKNILKLAPNDTTLLNMLGYCFEKKDQYADAVEIYRNIVELDPDNYNACNSLAYILALSNGNLTEALQFVQKALKAAPENPAYIDTLGFIYLKKGNTDLSKEHLKKALSLMPDSEEIREHLQQLLKIEK